jgi:hypothetical protein
VRNRNLSDSGQNDLKFKRIKVLNMIWMLIWHSVMEEKSAGFSFGVKVNWCEDDLYSFRR